MPNGFGQQYSRALTTARRRARLSGRRLTTQETAGMTRGLAESASARLARGRGLELQERGLTQQREMQAQRLASEKKRYETGREWQAGQREASQEFQAGQAGLQRGWQTGERTAGQIFQTGERTAGQIFQTGERAGEEAWETEEMRLNREEEIRQFDILYGGPSPELTSSQQELTRLKRERARPPGAVRPQYYGGSAGAER